MGVKIDGSYGEGGGQILRTALALSAILEKPVEVVNIRAGRRNPGLQAQHLTAVKAVAQLSGARLTGAELGSLTLRFLPGPLRGADYFFEVGTAGAVSLVFQAIALPMAFANGPCRVTIRGGTHVPWSPPFHYLDGVFLPAALRMGLHTSLKLLRWGFYPRGGGEVLVEAQPSSHLKSLVLEKRGALLGIRGFSAIANLPHVIAERQRGQALSRLSAEGLGAQIEIVAAASPSPGTCLFLLAEFEHARAGFSALGERGKPAEKVADEVVEALLAFLRSEAAVDPFLADQLLLPMALAEGTSHMTTSRLSQHLFTNAWVIEQFLPIRIDVEGEVGRPGRVTVEGVGFR